MQVFDTKLAGLKLIKPKAFGDARGFFFEGFQEERYQALGMTDPIVQLNFSRSTKNVLRGLHYQLAKPQDKLVTVTRGKVWDVAVDIRTDSPTFGQWDAYELSDENHWQLYIPKGFAHGFIVLSDEADFCYACTDYYDPASEKGVLWSDPALNISWQIQDPILSAKDKVYPCLKDIPKDELL
ncbi:MAG: dTDP-4-dehydrorhamnose 3,5-epimerase [Gammaproteobacteria bacterium]|jgi:dTDP-4-dehydrorhamnose 3,5-epimerase|nr:dTDP-4-dehydrorhamnose 3,5-epimerase [Gammaproteobacteria bacterium]